MLHNNPEFLANQGNLRHDYKSQAQREAVQGQIFQQNFDAVFQGKVGESMNTASDPSMKKKKKDTEEIMDEFREIKEDVHDALALESHIRQVFRKIGPDSMTALEDGLVSMVRPERVEDPPSTEKLPFSDDKIIC